MATKGGDIIPVSFTEHPVVNYLDREANPYDVSATGTHYPPSFQSNSTFDMAGYCYCLLFILYSLSITEIPHFIEYQCLKVSDPFNWLKALKLLVGENSNNPKFKKCNACTAEILICIDNKNQLFKSTDKTKISTRAKSKLKLARVLSPFDFRSLKNKANKLKFFEDKMILYIKAREEFLQENADMEDAEEMTYFKQIDFAINALRQIQEVKDNSIKKLSKKEKALTSPSAKKPFADANENKVPNKKNWNGSVIQLAYTYRELSSQLTNKNTNRPFLDYPFKEIAEFLYNTYCIDGKDLSMETLLTYLDPHRNIKEPRKKIDLSEINSLEV